jgi:hypothetical protein
LNPRPLGYSMSKPAPIYGGPSRPCSPASALLAASQCLTASRMTLPVHGVSTTPEPRSAGGGQLECPIRRHDLPLDFSDTSCAFRPSTVTRQSHKPIPMRPAVPADYLFRIPCRRCSRRAGSSRHRGAGRLARPRSSARRWRTRRQGDPRFRKQVGPVAAGSRSRRRPCLLQPGRGDRLAPQRVQQVRLEP